MNKWARTWPSTHGWLASSLHAYQVDDVGEARFWWLLLSTITLWSRTGNEEWTIWLVKETLQDYSLFLYLSATLVFAGVIPSAGKSASLPSSCSWSTSRAFSDSCPRSSAADMLLGLSRDDHWLIWCGWKEEDNLIYTNLQSQSHACMRERDRT